MADTACLFCQSSGPGIEITDEDVISLWLRDVLTSAVIGTKLSAERTVLELDGTMSRKPWNPRKLPLIKVPVVCRQCNNGWMSDYDGKVKHLLKSMILGDSDSLTVEQQFTIATWATLKAMVLEFGWGNDKPPVFTQADRDVLMTLHRPPASVEVRVAALESNGMPLYIRHYGSNGPDPATRRPGPAHLCLTVAYGCFLFQVTGGAAAGDERLRREPVAARTYLQIYPPAHGPIQWPPATALGDSQIDAFSRPQTR